MIKFGSIKVIGYKIRTFTCLLFINCYNALHDIFIKEAKVVYLLCITMHDSHLLRQNSVLSDIRGCSTAMSLRCVIKLRCNKIGTKSSRIPKGNEKWKLLEWKKDRVLLVCPQFSSRFGFNDVRKKYMLIYIFYGRFLFLTNEIFDLCEKVHLSIWYYTATLLTRNCFILNKQWSIRSTNFMSYLLLLLSALVVSSLC